MKTCAILLVDDDVEDFLIMKDAFSDMGADESLAYAESGTMALEMLNRQFDSEHTVPDMIVLDINMPLMNGIEVLRTLRADERFKGIEVVMYSTSINPDDEDECRELGVHYFISKPSRLEEIIRVGETLLAICEKRDPLILPDLS